MEATKSSPGDPAEDLAARIRGKVAPIDHWVRAVAKERPLLVLAVAVGVGYFVGRMLRR